MKDNNDILFDTKLRAKLAAENLQRRLNFEQASKMKGQDINLHKEFAHKGGIKEVILALNIATSEMADSHERVIIEQLQEVLIKKHYPLECWNFLDLIVSR